MPLPITTITAARDYPAKEQLIFAHDLERYEMQRYRGLALSFLPIRPSISRLMAALGVECEQRLIALETLAERLHLRDCLPGGRPTWPQLRFRLSQAQPLYRFITDEAMACHTLAYALAAAHHSRQISELVAQSSRTAEVETLVGHFIEQKRNECDLLEQAQDKAYNTMV
ncbi:hypothetical protein KG088_04015 [Halomonas sp. TRM85114]|uniref:hypothetical protein n=1 Tax=Halomonas jincaotanensis TaxID=2810616 RepID=UPI001BD5D7F0|nr:hypothetical protein [Halomonas jincaotanensis]MBS9402786.1 hypothetical protein [Halomonas jincaotanensis]